MRILTLGIFLLTLTISCAQHINSNDLFKNESKFKLTTRLS